MAYEETTVDGALGWMGAIRNFILGYKEHSHPVFTGAGGGKLVAFGAEETTSLQTYTVTCTDATTEGDEVWSVTGSVTGAMANATSRVEYDNSGVHFIIQCFDVQPFQAGDSFTITTTGTGSMNSEAHLAVLDHYELGATTLSQYYGKLWFTLKGNGTDNISVGIDAVDDLLGGYHHLKHRTGEVYSGTPTLDGFGDPSPDPYYSYCSYDEAQPVWLQGTPYHLYSFVKSQSYYHSLGFGYYFPYAPSNSQPSPLIHFGNEHELTTYSDLAEYKSSFVKGGRGFNSNFYRDCCAIRVGLDWYPHIFEFKYSSSYYTPILTDLSNKDMAHLYVYQNTDDRRFTCRIDAIGGLDRQIEPFGSAIPYSNYQILLSHKGLVGELRDVKIINTAQVLTEDTVTIDGLDYICMQSISESGRQAKILLKMS